MLQPIHQQTDLKSQQDWNEISIEERLYGWLEAMLYATDHPLSLDALTELLGTPDTPQAKLRQKIEEVLEEIKNQYNLPHRGIHLVEVAGGWQFRTNPAHSFLLRKLFAQRPPRLSQAAVECMAVVAYRQPVTRSEVEAIRGVDCGGVMRTLLDRKMLHVVGRSESPGRPYLYGTSPEFLEFFGLENLGELPPLQPPKKSKESKKDKA